MSANTQLTEECMVCARLGKWDGIRLVEPFVPPANLGHDGVAHRIYQVLKYRKVRTAADLAAMRDVELLRLDGIGATAFKRIREFVPAPSGAVQRQLSCGATPNGLLCACGKSAGHADGEVAS